MNLPADERVRRGACVALAAVPIVALGMADGGFYPRPWAWAALGLALAAVGVLMTPRPAFSRPPLVLLLFLVALGIWIVASLAWTRSPGLTVLELRRLLVYVAAMAAAALVVRRSSAGSLSAGIFAGTTAVTTWGLGAYLTTRGSASDPFQGAYLHRPLGYANAMGITCVIAILVALGLLVDRRGRRLPIVAGVSLVPLFAALALTGSRASVAALAIGLFVSLALARDRADMLRAWLVVLIVPLVAALAVYASGVTSTSIAGDAGARLGYELLAVVVALSALALLPARMTMRKRPFRTHGSPRVWIAAAAVTGCAVVAVGLLRGVGLAGDRPVYWRVALAEVREHPVLGTGAGTFPRVWLERRQVDRSVHDAHSLLVEAGMELGPVGLLLVCALLSLPLVWAVRSRGSPIVVASGGAFAAYAAHAAVDWDWEMPAVTLAALFCAVVVGVASAPDSAHVRCRGSGRGLVLGAAVVCSLVALVGLVSASSLEDASRALARGDARAAEQAARRAERWEPWADDPALTLGQALRAMGDTRAARAAFARAVAHDPDDYRAWLALATVSRGEAARVALLEAKALNPMAFPGL